MIVIENGISFGIVFLKGLYFRFIVEFDLLEVECVLSELLIVVFDMMEFFVKLINVKYL